MMPRVLFVLLLFLIGMDTSHAASTGDTPPPLPRERVIIRAHDNPKGAPRAVFRAEIARTREEQQRGLMNRPKLPKNNGMLFVFDPPATVGFWMKDTLIPLDMLFIDANGRITKIYDQAEPHDESPISSGGDVRAVLEILGGEAEARGIQVGDNVFSPTLKKLSADQSRR